jgi:hypothetical protein
LPPYFIALQLKNKARFLHVQNAAFAAQLPPNRYIFLKRARPRYILSLSPPQRLLLENTAMIPSRAGS